LKASCSGWSSPSGASPSTVSTLDHRAGAAVPGVTADVRPGQVEVVAQEVDEQPPHLHVALVALAVDFDRDALPADRLHHADAS
jgi:hypothetical protein